MTSYKKAGVDIREIKKSQQAIGKIIASTHKSQKIAKMTHGFGHYAGIVEIPGGKLLATHTDGVGTKVIIANMMKKFDTIGIDLVAMNVNDLIVQGAKPIFFLDYIATSKIKEKVFIETWTLHNAWIKDVNFGSLSYDNEGLVDLSMTLRFDWAVHNPGNSSTIPTL